MTTEIFCHERRTDAYLLKARPQALGVYFAFLKDAGKHLDPKTKNLISVITKVRAQTERGLRQYPKRALRKGCSPAEVLDALLMVFPALGPAKIIWAVDIILEMSLPGFDAAALDDSVPVPVPAADPGQWHDVTAFNDLMEVEVTRTGCEGRSLFIYREKEKFIVFDSQCPHQKLRQSAQTRQIQSDTRPLGSFLVSLAL